MKLRSLVPLTASVALLLSTEQAFAEEDPGPRLGSGAALASGPLIVPGFLTGAFIALQGQIGVQLNNFLGLYTMMDLDGAFLPGPAVSLAGALLVELTFSPLISVAVGPELSYFDTGLDFDTDGREHSRNLYGGRLRVDWRPLTWDSADPKDAELPVGRRGMLTIGFEVRLLKNGSGFLWGFDRSGVPWATSFVLVPTLNIGVVRR